MEHRASDNHYCVLFELHREASCSQNFALLHISYFIAATASKRMKVDRHWHLWVSLHLDYTLAAWVNSCVDT